MPVDESTSRLLRDLAGETIAELEDEYSRISPHLGEESAEEPRPNGRSNTDTATNLNWLSFSFDPYPMWDVHVGVLADDAPDISIGVHFRDEVAETPPPYIRALGEELGLQYAYRENVGEHQFNSAPIAVDNDARDVVSQKIANMCRIYEGYVDRMQKE